MTGCLYCSSGDPPSQPIVVIVAAKVDHHVLNQLAGTAGAAERRHVLLCVTVVLEGDRIERVIEEAEAELAAARATSCGTCQGVRVQAVVGDGSLPASPCPECGGYVRVVHIVPDDDDAALRD